MRTFNESELKVVRDLIATEIGKLSDVQQFLQQFFFTETNQRAMIIQIKSRYAVYYIPDNKFNDEAQKKQELVALVNLINLLTYLRNQGYITIHKTDSGEEKAMHFINDGFRDPQPSSGKILLNGKGDYTANPEFIRNEEGHIIAKGIFFKDESFDLIASLFVGVLTVSSELKSLINEKPKVEEEPKKKEKTTRVKGLAIGLIVLVILFLGGGALAYFKSLDYDQQLSELKQGQEDVLNSIPDSIQMTGGGVEISHQPVVSVDTTKQAFYGIDISRWNGHALTEITPEDSITFIICKATQSVDYEDPDFKSNWEMAKEKNFIRGAYHFYIYGEDPTKQAEHFWSVISRLDSTDMAPVLDIEEESLPAHENVDKVNLQVDLLQFLKRLEELSGRAPMVYVDVSFANKYLSNKSFAKYPLWVAEYTNSTQPKTPETWKETGYKIWQKSDHYDIDSHHTDFDLFKGQKDELYY